VASGGTGIQIEVCFSLHTLTKRYESELVSGEAHRVCKFGDVRERIGSRRQDEHDRGLFRALVVDFFEVLNGRLDIFVVAIVVLDDKFLDAIDNSVRSETSEQQEHLERGQFRVPFGRLVGLGFLQIIPSFPFSLVIL
jgi:hypothetical protein